jgi:hypothetical protein
MELAYVAHSERCVLLLDSDGVCRWFVMKVVDEAIAASAKRCIGAQFVATLDPSKSAFLAHDPEVGKSVLLARVDDGRVSLVRFGPLTQFETLEATEAKEVIEREASRASLASLEPETARSLAAVAEESDTTIQRLVKLGDDEDDLDEMVTAGVDLGTRRESGFSIRVAPPIELEPATAETRAAIEPDVENEGETRPFARIEREELRARSVPSRRRGVLPRH